MLCTGIRDNIATPSHLVLETRSHANNTVDGVLTWNVTRGWEGYAYRLCVTARHVPAEIAGGHAEASDVRTRMAGLQESLGAPKALVASRLDTVQRPWYAPNTSSTVPCRDAAGATSCAAWRDAGECERNVGFMRERCTKTCGRCDDAHLHGGDLHRAERCAITTRVAPSFTREIHCTMRCTQSVDVIVCGPGSSVPPEPS